MLALVVSSWQDYQKFFFIKLCLAILYKFIFSVNNSSKVFFWKQKDGHGWHLVCSSFPLCPSPHPPPMPFLFSEVWVQLKVQLDKQNILTSNMNLSSLFFLLNLQSFPGTTDYHTNPL